MKTCKCAGWKANHYRLMSSLSAAEQYGFTFDMDRHFTNCPFCGSELETVSFSVPEKKGGCGLRRFLGERGK